MALTTSEGDNDPYSYTQKDYGSGYNCIGNYDTSDYIVKAVIALPEKSKMNFFTLFSYNEYLMTYWLYKYEGDKEAPTPADDKWTEISTGPAQYDGNYNAVYSKPRVIVTEPFEAKYLMLVGKSKEYDYTIISGFKAFLV